jgi:hypothetical protein
MHKVLVLYPSIREIVNLTARYMPSMPFPKKALDVLEESVVYVKKLKEKIVLPWKRRYDRDGKLKTMMVSPNNCTLFSFSCILSFLSPKTNVIRRISTNFQYPWPKSPLGALLRLNLHHHEGGKLTSPMLCLLLGKVNDPMTRLCYSQLSSSF